MTTKPDVVIGAGHFNFVGSYKYFTEASYNSVSTDPEYVYVERVDNVTGSDALKAAKDQAIADDKKLFGVFGAWQIDTPTVTDTPGAPTFAKTDNESPVLEESTEAAIEVLSQDTDGFFLMVEQGDIDWNNHANNYAGMVGAVLDLDRAVAKTVSMVDNNTNGMSWDNTLVIVTSDHGNSYLRFNTTKELGMGDLPAQVADNGSCEYEYCGDFIYPEGDVFYGTGGHTNELVSIYAKGKNVELFSDEEGKYYSGTSLIDNTQIYSVMKEAAENGTKNVILFIGDGMQKAHEIAGSRYMYGGDDNLTFHSFDWTGNVTTWDVDSYNSYAAAKGANKYDGVNIDWSIGYDAETAGELPYPLLEDYFMNYDGNQFATDSASAGTAMATGLKTDSGNISWETLDPADGDLITIGEKVRHQRGGAIGIVSTVEFSHATPATFASHNINRGNYGEIADEIVQNIKPEVVIGAGHPSYVGEYKYITEDSYNALANGSEYVFVERTDGVYGGSALLAAADTAVSSGKKLFGLFGDWQIATPIATDTPGSPSVADANTDNPLLSQSTEAALKVLSQDEDGFFLMVEQGTSTGTTMQTTTPAWSVPYGILSRL